MDKEEFKSIHFPHAGIDMTARYEDQPNRPTIQGRYSRTTRQAMNCRSFEPATDRMRGGQRGGLTQYIPNPVGYLTQLVQQLGIVVEDSPMELNQSGRSVLVIAVAGGYVYTASPGDPAFSTPTNNTLFTPPLNAAGIVFSAVNNQKCWFADGSNWCYYDPNTNSVETWIASAGQLPVDIAGNTPRLICTWRGRTVLSGLFFDPQDWFMSRVGDPTDFDYGPESVDPTQAIAGENAPQGLVGDIVTNLIPYNDDVLIFGGDHTIYMLQGDPMLGGQIGLLSDAIGMAWGQAWCRDPYGTVYFVSNRMGIYSLQPGTGQITRMSQQIEQFIQDIDTGQTCIRLIWDDRFQGLHVFLTPVAGPAPATHLFWEQRVGAWWFDQFSSIQFNPLCCVTFDGNLPGDRVALIGSWDGFIRYLDPAAPDDDGIPIQSTVTIGPLVTENLDEIMAKDFQAILAEESAPVTYAVYVGRSAEAALNTTPVATGTWQPGRNPLEPAGRWAGHAIYITLSASAPWALEAIRCRLATQGKVRRRTPY
jgi:hypothetical protein